jgi:hypothetical protein
MSTPLAPVGTRPAYYANVAVAAMVGDSGARRTQVVQVPLPLSAPGRADTQVVYAAYEHSGLQRVMVVNMQAWNGTAPLSNGVAVPATAARPVATYYFTAPAECAGTASVSRLLANGSDAVTGTTWDGYSYEYELQLGRPVLLSNGSGYERITVDASGKFRVNVPWSSAAMVRLNCTWSGGL